MSRIEGSNFIEMLFDTVVEDYRLPKVQMERTVETILHIFIEDLLNSYFFLNNYTSDCIRLVAVEFPFKKEEDTDENLRRRGRLDLSTRNQIDDSEEDGTNQSENVDYMLIGDRTLYLVELKTASSSFDEAQAQLYASIKNHIEKDKNFSSKLVSDIDIIMNSSKYEDKYRVLKWKIEKFRNEILKIEKVKIIYIAPIKAQKKFESVMELIIETTAMEDNTKTIDEVKRIYAEDMLFWDFRTVANYDLFGGATSSKALSWMALSRRLAYIDYLDINKTLSVKTIDSMIRHKVCDIDLYINRLLPMYKMFKDDKRVAGFKLLQNHSSTYIVIYNDNSNPKAYYYNNKEYKPKSREEKKYIIQAESQPEISISMLKELFEEELLGDYEQ